MLMMIGAVAVEVYPFNATGYTESGEGSFAEKAVLGARQPLEAVGKGADTLKVQAKLFPAKLGGLAELELLRAQMASQISLPVMRGDGIPLGWRVVTELEARHSHLGRDGVGQVIEVDITLKRADPPGAAAIVAMLSGLFG